MKVIPFFIIFVETNGIMVNENLMGFERKLREILGNSGKVGEIIGLIPDNVFLPLYFKGDVVRLRDGNKITITDVGLDVVNIIIILKMKTEKLGMNVKKIW